MFLYRIAADVIVVLHALFVLYVVLLQVLIVVGAFRRWKWIRRFWLRVIHLAAIAFVVSEDWLGIMCPLTDWEQQLRDKAGETAYRGDFLAHWAHELLFYDIPQWVFTALHTTFGLTVLLAFLVAPPHWPRRKTKT